MILVASQSTSAISQSDSATTLPQNDTVVDKYNATYWMCLVVGTASLLPCNCLLTSGDLWQYHHADKNILLQMAAVLNVFNFIFTAILIPTSHLISIPVRIVLWSVFTAILLLMVTSFIHHYTFVLLVAIFCGISCGIMCCSIIAFAQIFSKKYVPNYFDPELFAPSSNTDTYRYIQAAFIGQSLSMLFSSALRVITKLTFPGARELGCSVYFAITAAFLIIAAILFYTLLRSEFVKYHLKIQGLRRELQKKRNWEYYRQIQQKLITSSLSIFLLLAVSMTVLPSFLLNVSSEWDVLNEDKWITVVVGSIWAVADYLGRQIVVIKIQMNTVCVLSVVRICTIPIAVLLYKSVIVSEWVLYIFTMFVGLTHGQLTCFTFMEYSECLEVEEQETGTVIMEFWLVAGTAFSGLLSWILEQSLRF